MPSVNNVKLTGADGLNPWPRGPNHTGGYQLDGRFGTLQEQALGALLNHAQIQNAAAAATARRFDLVSARSVHESTRARAVRRDRRRAYAVARYRPAAQRARAAGQDGFTARALSVTAAPVSPRHRRPWFATTISSRSARGPSTPCPAAIQPQPCPPRLARNARTYEITLPNGTTTRRAPIPAARC